MVAATAAKVREQEGRERCSCSHSCDCHNPTEEGRLDQEYELLQRVGPAPGDMWRQHDAMVTAELCQSAVKHPECNRCSSLHFTFHCFLRYSNLFPYDDTRVVLEGGGGDYINASWHSCPGVDSPAILTMGPLHPAWHGEDTVAHFWQMVRQTRAGLVVMLCKEQKGYGGCSGYWPGQGQEVEHGGCKVVGLGEEARGWGRRRGLALDGKQVLHLQFTEWPNYGVVERMGLLASFVREVVEQQEEVEQEARRQDQRVPPLVVHCSGGVGRSGAFTTIYSLYRLALAMTRGGGWEYLETHLEQEEITLVPLVTSLRENRHPWAVEGDHQYKLAYGVLLELLQGLLEEKSTLLN